MRPKNPTNFAGAVVGWCHKHSFVIPEEKFHQKCKHARQGKRCKSFDYKIPSWVGR